MMIKHSNYQVRRDCKTKKFYLLKMHYRMHPSKPLSCDISIINEGELHFEC